MEEFTPRDMEFLAQIDQLPERFREYFLPPLDDGLIIPSENGDLGDMSIHFFDYYFLIRIGDHTEEHITTAKEAVFYINEILRDRIVFQLKRDGVIYYKSEDFENLNEISRDMQVWSGSFWEAFRSG